MMDRFLETEYFNNTVLDYGIALGIIVLGILAVRLLKHFILERLRRWADHTKTMNDNFIIENIDRFGIPALYYFIIYSGLSYLALSEKAANVIHIASSVVITFFILRLLSSVILMLLRNYIKRQENGEEKVNQLAGMMIIINIVVWVLGIVFLIDNLGYNVATIITGLGIGGIAVALAAQNILGDLFNYFVIFFDRPFEVGDFIIVDDKLGTIEYIGIKTTRIRSLSGEQLIIGNSNLTTSRIHNYKRFAKRRVVFTFEVDYKTPLEKLKLIPELMKSIILQQDLVTFDRAHFASFREWSLRYEIVYYILSADYNVYMDIQQAVNFLIVEEFEKHDIRFAFPLQKLSFESDLTISEHHIMNDRH